MANLFHESNVAVLAPTGPGEVQSALREVAYHLLLLCVTSPDDAALSYIKELDQRRGPRSAPIALVCDEVPEEWFCRAVKAGVDAEMRRSKGRDYVIAHTDALLRLGRRPASECLLSEARPAAQAALHGSLDSIVKAAAWRDGRKLLLSAATQFLTMGATLGPQSVTEAEIACGAQILMGNAEDKVELRVAVGADRKSVKMLAMHVFGDDGDDMGKELLSELGNIFMGTLKTAFSSEAVKFAAGLPEEVPPSRVLHPPLIYSVQDSVELKIAEARVVVYLGIRTNGSGVVPVSSLLEGMLVTKDVFNQKGLMLVRGGTRLSLNMVEKLRGLLPHKEPVEVMAS